MRLSPASLVQRDLINGGYGTLPPNANWPISVSFMPTTPDNYITVYDAVGLTEGRIQTSGETITHPGVQIRVRSLDYNQAYHRIWLITKRLDVVRNELIIIDNEAYTIHSITRTGDPLSLGREEGSNRSLLVVNMLLTISGGPSE